MSLVQVLHFRLNVKKLALKWKILVQHWNWINTHYLGRIFKIFRIKKGDTVRIAFFMHCQLNWKCNMAPPVGLEPTTSWLTVTRSTDWAKEDYYLRETSVLWNTPVSLLCRLWPIFPARRHASIFGSAELNFRVRNGNGWTLCGKITDFCHGYYRDRGLKAPIASPLVTRLCQRWPIFPARRHASIFGSAELNFRVRNGNGWTLCGKNTDYITLELSKKARKCF